MVRMIWAILTVVVGLWLVLEPHNGTLTLTFVLGVYFLFMGLTRIAVAFVGRGQPNAGLVGLSGVAGLIIGILVLAKFPSSADWAIGLLVGIDLIFAGWTLTSVALVGKDWPTTGPVRRGSISDGRALTPIRSPGGLPPRTRHGGGRGHAYAFLDAEDAAPRLRAADGRLADPRRA